MGLAAAHATKVPELESELAQCAHCGLPVPAGLVRPSEPEQFCCAGCRSVRQLLESAGFSRYYQLREQALADGDAGFSPADCTESNYADYDTPRFTAQYCERTNPHQLRVDLYLAGVHCVACLWLLEKLPELVQGVSSSILDLERKVLEVEWYPTQVSLSAIARQLDRLGYPPRPYSDLDVRDARRGEERRLLTRLGVAGAIAGNVMLLSFALYSGAFSGMAAEFRRFFEVCSLVVSLPALTYCAAEFYRGAWASFETRTPHMDLPVSLGIAAGGLWGAINVVRGEGDVYFDTVTLLVFLLLLGRYLELRQQNRARAAAERAHLLTPGRARVVSSAGVTEDVLVEDIKVGDVVEVLSGETLPVDGVVTSGTSDLDNRILTGESLPTTALPGSLVYAGATSLTGKLRVRSSCPGAQTRVALLMREVERARRSRPRVVRLADRVAARFVIAILALALVTLLLWWPHDRQAALQHAIALLIVACPCALGLATPLAVSAALARAARARILIKGGDVLEAVSRPKLIVFDKTGTLTTGNLSLCHWEGDATLKPVVRAMEANSAHPVGRALCRAIPATPTVAVTEVSEHPGGGLEARVGRELMLVGSPDWLVRRGVTRKDWVDNVLLEQTALGRTPVAVAVGGRVRALAFFEDPLAEDVPGSLGRLRAMGYRFALLSGDHPAVTRSVARRLSVAAGHEQLFDEVVGGASPEAKLEYVRAVQLKRPVMVVGDGVNDAAALAEAEVGVAVKGGAEASLLAADVYLAESGLGRLVELVTGSRRTVSVVWRGIAMSLAYNVVGVGLAMAGLLGPLVAALLMPVSSLSVVTNAYRAKSFEGRQ